MNVAKVRTICGNILAVILIAGGLVVVGHTLTTADWSGKNQPFAVVDQPTQSIHWVTEASLEACKGKPHYTTVNVDGVERRCVKIKGE